MKDKTQMINVLILFFALSISVIAMARIVDVDREEDFVYESQIESMEEEIRVLNFTPTPTMTPTPTPSPTCTPTPTPKPTPIAVLSNQEWYDECLARGLINGVQEDHITKERGGCYGPSGQETYYNLRMDKCVEYMRDLGYSEEEYPYWIRDDGAKMLGNYVMCAANWKIRPKGTILPTSLGDAIVVDTGEFVTDYPYNVDLAVDW
jgi:hypothetical protein